MVKGHNPCIATVCMVNCCSFVLFLAEELGDFGAELKLSLFQLGISPQIIASIIMQV